MTKTNTRNRPEAGTGNKHRLHRLLGLLILLSAIPASATDGKTTEFTSFAQFVAQAGALTTINFDSTPTGDGAVTQNTFASFGASFIHRNGGPINVGVKGTGFFFQNNANSGSKLISSSINANGSYTDRTDNIDIVFDFPVRAAGLWVGNVEPGSTDILFLDAAGNILARESLSGSTPGLVGTTGGDNRVFYGAVSDSLIERIRVVEPAGDSDGITLDDVQFSANAVTPPGLASTFSSQSAFAAAVTAAGDTLAVEGFETLNSGDGALKGTEFSPSGLTIVHRDRLPINVLHVPDGYATQNNAEGSQVISSSISPGFGWHDDRTDSMDFIFRQPVKAAGLFVGNVAPGSTALEFLDVKGRVITGITLSASSPDIIPANNNTGDNRVFFGVISRIPIARIRTIEGAWDSDGVTYDNIQFSAYGAVPEKLTVLTFSTWQWSFTGQADNTNEIAKHIIAMSPDLVAFQEARDSAAGAMLNSLGYHVLIQFTNPNDPTGLILGSRWSFKDTLSTTPSSPQLESLILPTGTVTPYGTCSATNLQYAMQLATVLLPAPFGDVMFVNPKPAWEATVNDACARREQADRIVSNICARQNATNSKSPIILAGDLDDISTSPSVSRLTAFGFRDSWLESSREDTFWTNADVFSSGQMGDGYTFSISNASARNTIQNTVPRLADSRRIDYVMVLEPAPACPVVPPAPPEPASCKLQRFHFNGARVVMDGTTDFLDGTVSSSPDVAAHYGVLAELRATESVCP